MCIRDSVSPAEPDTLVPCDTTNDGLGDSLCEVVAAYPCSGVADVRASFVPVDTDGDGQLDECQPAFAPNCDTTGDAFGDGHCFVELGAGPTDSGR